MLFRSAGGGRRCCTLAIFSGKLFLIRDSETPAGVSESPFHGWGVKGSSICSTAFCESAALRGYPFRHRLRRCHLPQGDGLYSHRKEDKFSRASVDRILFQKNFEKMSDRTTSFSLSATYFCNPLRRTWIRYEDIK